MDRHGRARTARVRCPGTPARGDARPPRRAASHPADEPSPEDTVAPMAELRVLTPVAPADVVAIGRLHDAAEASDGGPALNDAVWRDLDAAGPESAGVLATDDETAVGYAHVARSDNFSPPHWAIGLVVHPDHRDGGL